MRLTPLLLSSVGTVISSGASKAPSVASDQGLMLYWQMAVPVVELLM